MGPILKAVMSVITIQLLIQLKVQAVVLIQLTTAPDLVVSVIMLLATMRSNMTAAVPSVTCHARMAKPSMLAQSLVSILASSRSKDGESEKRNCPQTLQLTAAT